MAKFEINKIEYTLDFTDCAIIANDSVIVQFDDIKEMTLFVNRVSDLLEKELNSLERESKETK